MLLLDLYVINIIVRMSNIKIETLLTNVPHKTLRKKMRSIFSVI